jgi:hypothetical protein
MKRAAIGVVLLVLTGCAAAPEVREASATGDSALTSCANEYVEQGESLVKSVDVVETKGGFSAHVELTNGLTYDSSARSEAPATNDLDGAKVCFAAPDASRTDDVIGEFRSCWWDRMDQCDARNHCGWSRRCFVGCVAWATAMCI